MKRNLELLFLRISAAGFLLLSVSFLLMPLPAVGYAPGILFWLGLAVGIAFQIILEVRRRAFFKKRNLDIRKYQNPKWGIILFFSNKLAKIADISMAVTLTGLVISGILTSGTGDICFLFLGTFAFSLCMHCILNGRNYFHAHNRRRIERALEQKKTAEKGEK